MSSTVTAHRPDSQYARVDSIAIEAGASCSLFFRGTAADGSATHGTISLDPSDISCTSPTVGRLERYRNPNTGQEYLIVRTRSDFQGEFEVALNGGTRTRLTAPNPAAAAPTLPDPTHLPPARNLPHVAQLAESALTRPEAERFSRAYTLRVAAGETPAFQFEILSGARQGFRGTIETPNGQTSACEVRGVGRVARTTSPDGTSTFTVFFPRDTEVRITGQVGRQTIPFGTQVISPPHVTVSPPPAVVLPPVTLVPPPVTPPLVPAVVVPFAPVTSQPLRSTVYRNDVERSGTELLAVAGATRGENNTFVLNLSVRENGQDRVLASTYRFHQGSWQWQNGQEWVSTSVRNYTLQGSNARREGEINAVSQFLGRLPVIASNLPDGADASFSMQPLGERSVPMLEIHRSGGNGWGADAIFDPKTREFQWRTSQVDAIGNSVGKTTWSVIGTGNSDVWFREDGDNFWRDLNNVGRGLIARPLPTAVTFPVFLEPSRTEQTGLRLLAAAGAHHSQEQIENRTVDVYTLTHGSEQTSFRFMNGEWRWEHQDGWIAPNTGRWSASATTEGLAMANAIGDVLARLNVLAANSPAGSTFRAGVLESRFNATLFLETMPAAGEASSRIVFLRRGNGYYWTEQPEGAPVAGRDSWRILPDQQIATWPRR